MLEKIFEVGHVEEYILKRQRIRRLSRTQQERGPSSQKERHMWRLRGGREPSCAWQVGESKLG